MKARLAGVRRHWERWALAALLLVHVALGVYWSVTIPIFEAHDEDGHYYFVRFLATERRLPGPGDKSPSPNDEMHQPPLYYVLAALPVSFVDVSDALAPRYNPYMAWPNAQGGQNRVIHDPVAESWPYRGDILAIHVARWVSVLLGSLALVFTFLAARTLCPGEPWVRWGAVLVHAFWPQFRFTTSVINNDLMMTVSAAAVTWLLVRVIVAPHVRVRDLLALGAASGLALLSKGNGLALAPVVLLVLLAKVLMAERAGRGRVLAGLGGSLALGGFAVGWWYLRNLSSGTAVFGGARSGAYVRWLLGPLFGDRAFRWDLVQPAVRHGLVSWWAGFGWNNLELPRPVYVAAAVGAVLGLLALGVAVLQLVRRSAHREIAGLVSLVLVASTMIGVPLFLRVSVQGVELHGRILLSAVPATSVLLGLAWATLLPRLARPAAWALMAGSLAVLAALTPGQYIRPAYAQPPRLDETELANYAPVHATFGDFVELVGYRVHNASVGPGDRLRVTLVWRVLAQTPEDYFLKLIAFDRDDTLGEVWRYPGQGSLATTTWQPGHLFAEEAAIPIRTENSELRQIWLEVRYRGPAKAEVRDGQGRSVGEALRIGGIKVWDPREAVATISEDSLQFGPLIRLMAGEVALASEGHGQQLDLGLRWAVEERPSRDYVVSLQLRDANDGMVGQLDDQPRQGTYPTTLWEPGEVVRDPYALPLPASLPDGAYTLYLCMYDPSTLQRLQIVDPMSSSQARDEVALARLTVAGGRPDLVALHPLMTVE